MKRILIIVSVLTAFVFTSASTATAADQCLFCGVPRIVSDSVIWIVVHGDSGLPEPGETVFPPDENGDPPVWFPPADDFSDGGEYKGWRVVCDFTGCHWVWFSDYRSSTPPETTSNWWDGWNGDCNNPPIDPSGQEVWSWC